MKTQEELVDAFAHTMKYELNQNTHKGDWREWKDIEKIKNELSYHLSKLENSMLGNDVSRISEYLADCGNFLLMIGNAYGIYNDWVPITPEQVEGLKKQQDPTSDAYFDEPKRNYTFEEIEEYWKKTPIYLESSEESKLRDTFAGQAMQALISKDNLKLSDKRHNGQNVGEAISMISYEYADEMLKQRNNKIDKKEL